MFRYGVTCCSGLFLLWLYSLNANSSEWVFDPKLLGAGSEGVNIDILNKGGQLPGTYWVDVYVNDAIVDSRDVIFKSIGSEGKSQLYPCLSIEQLSSYGINVEKYPKLGNDVASCANLNEIDFIKYDFKLESNALSILVPQVAMKSKVGKGIAPESLWDDGLPVFLMNYSVNMQRLESEGYSGAYDSNTTSYAQISPGFNIGGWRVRNQTAWQKDGYGNSTWQYINTYAEHGINALKSRVVVGDYYTPGDVFQSFAFRGVMLGADSSMVPWELRAYAPVINGVARTQARIEVKQNGYTIYNETVSPGPFSLSDLPTVGSSGGDLEVVVWEADGSQQKFTVPFQTPAMSVKEGYFDYNLVGGFYRPSDSSVDQGIAQFSMVYGLPWDLTLYGGIQGAEQFFASTAGVGMSLGRLGAISLDVTASHAQRRESETEQGAAWRARYSKDFVDTNTSFTMASYQYASEHYNTLTDVLDTWSDDSYIADKNSARHKSDTSLTVSQSLGRMGNLSVSGVRSNYWDRSGVDDSFAISYGVPLANGISMTLNWSENKVSDAVYGSTRDNQLLSLWLSVPLNAFWGGADNINSTYQYTTEENGRDSQMLGINGDGFDKRLRWDFRQSYTSGGNSPANDNSLVRLDWYSPYGQFGGNYSQSDDQRQMGVSGTGGVIIHPKGVTFGQLLGETIALVEVPGAAGVSVAGGRGIETDYSGFTSYGWLTPYQENNVSLDALTLPDSVEMVTTNRKVIPTRGAVVPAEFSAKIGKKGVMTIQRVNGQEIPYGSVVYLASDENSSIGIVGKNSKVYLAGLPDSGRLKVKWGQGECAVNYSLPEQANSAGLYKVSGLCN